MSADADARGPMVIAELLVRRHDDFPLCQCLWVT
jgi:hypothetical protein